MAVNEAVIEAVKKFAELKDVENPNEGLEMGSLRKSAYIAGLPETLGVIQGIKEPDELASALDLLILEPFAHGSGEETGFNTDELNSLFDSFTERVQILTETHGSKLLMHSLKWAINFIIMLRAYRND